MKAFVFTLPMTELDAIKSHLHHKQQADGQDTWLGPCDRGNALVELMSKASVVETPGAKPNEPIEIPADSIHIGLMMEWRQDGKVKRVGVDQFADAEDAAADVFGAFLSMLQNFPAGHIPADCTPNGTTSLGWYLAVIQGVYTLQLCAQYK